MAATGDRRTESGIEVKPVYRAADAPRELEPPGEYPFTRGPVPGHVPRAAVDDPAVRGLRLGGGVERALPLSPRARPDRPLDRVRPADAARLRLRRPACAGRGRSHRRRDRLDRRHGDPARRHPARRGVDVDDDQRAGVAAAAPLRARRRAAGRGARCAPRHRPERHPQGVHRARELHLPAAALDAADDRPLRVLRRADPALEHDLHLAATTSARPARRRCRSSRSRSPTGSPTATRPLRRGCRPTTFGARLSFFFNAHNDFFQEVAKFRAARRLWARIMRERFGATNPKRARAPLPRADRRLDADGAAAGEQHRPRRDPGALGGCRRRAVAPHERLRRGARAADRARGARIALRTQQILAAEAGDDRHRRSARRLLLRRGADRRARGARVGADRAGGRARRRGRGGRDGASSRRRSSGRRSSSSSRSRPASASSSA